MTASPEASSDTPATGDRRAVAVTYHLSFFEPDSAADSDPQLPDENRYDKGPWELQEWDGMQWQTVGSATKRRSRNRFLRRSRSL